MTTQLQPSKIKQHFSSALIISSILGVSTSFADLPDPCYYGLSHHDIRQADHMVHSEGSKNKLPPFQQADFIDLEALSTITDDYIKFLAKEINSNPSLMSEVLIKISQKFDGQYGILINQLDPQTLKQLNKKASDYGLEIDLYQLIRQVPKLEFKMPKAKHWSYDQILNSGGLVLVKYPFGQDDKKIKQATGYNQYGDAITLSKKNAQDVPYMTLSINERSDHFGRITYGQRSGKMAKSIAFLSDKDLASEWKSQSMADLNHAFQKQQNPANGNITLNTIDCADDGDGGGGSGGPGGGSGDPVRYFELYQFQNNDDDDGFWDDELEFYVRIVQPSLGGSVRYTHARQVRKSGVWYYDEDGEGWKTLRKKLWKVTDLTNIHLNTSWKFHQGWFIELWEDDSSDDDFYGGYPFDIHSVSKAPSYTPFYFSNGAEIRARIAEY